MISRRRVSQAVAMAAGTVGLSGAGQAVAAQQATAATPAGTSGAYQGLGPLRHVRTDVLDIAYHVVGPADGVPVILLHGWPFSPVGSYAEVAPPLADRGFRCYIPYLRGHGETTFRRGSTFRSGQQAALGADLIEFMDALGIRRALYAGYDWGGRAANVAAALWPHRCAGLVSVNGYLIQNIARAQEPLAPSLELGFWYFFYFLTERGAKGLERNREDLGRVVWQRNSPEWQFTEAEFAQTAQLWTNPDYVAVTLHSYRHRLAAAPGAPRYEKLERRLLGQPTIPAPTVTLDGKADGVTPWTDGSSYQPHYTGPFAHHVVPGAGHNLPQERPDAFVSAILEVHDLG
ncbi:alpha/beta hydrolase [Streptomyces kunmingensis]|uniref:Alpha/beta hydrolase n=1 Tax=Streptomyces kunmingensis TaxID=68225 RepID=A0ABU6CCA4_9ACTN|nr:alpha/beta hydrolase [Streptomyces kunmingensis]MEB3962348.1 alpha/beta hydrolase [Streptomyces kunmingensis]